MLTILFSINPLPRHSHQTDLNPYARRLFISFYLSCLNRFYRFVYFPYAGACPPPSQYSIFYISLFKRNNVMQRYSKSFKSSNKINRVFSVACFFSSHTTGVEHPHFFLKTIIGCKSANCCYFSSCYISLKEKNTSLLNTSRVTLESFSCVVLLQITCFFLFPRDKDSMIVVVRSNSLSLPLNRFVSLLKRSVFMQVIIYQRGIV